MEKQLSPFSSLLRSLRAKSGMSLSQASRVMKISKAHLHDLESGKSDNPTLATVSVLSLAYGVSPSTIIRVGIEKFIAPQSERAK